MSEKKGLNRRDFLKIAGITGVSLPAMTVIGNIGGIKYIESPKAYGGFAVRHHDKAPYEVKSSYKRMRDRDNTFQRIDWDKTLYEKLTPPRPVYQKHMENKTPGKTRFDYAFMGGAWTVATTFGSLGSGGGGAGMFKVLGMPDMPESAWQAMGILTPPQVENGFYSWNSLGGFGALWYNLLSKKIPAFEPSDYEPQELTDMVKVVAKSYGADIVGVAELDERWVFADAYKGANKDVPIIFDDVASPTVLKDGTEVIPRSMKYVVTLAFEMDYDAISSPFTGPCNAEVAFGYSKMAFTAGSLAEFFRFLGYNAIPSGNHTAMSVPMAVDAGLGELGRNGLLITPKYGPRVRLAKVITDMPLVPDRPISFGVTEFCEICGKCAEKCPGKAISAGARTWEGEDFSNNPGTYKWYVNGPKCLNVWLTEGIDCNNCITVCPFNKPESWLHEVTRVLIGAQSGSLDKAILKLDDASAFGTPLNHKEFWNRKKKEL